MFHADAERQDAALFAFPDTPERRLRRALRRLDAALEEQRSAVAAFRAELVALNGAIAALGARAEGLRATLGDAAAETDRAHAAARQLMTSASALEAASHG
jgi:chromosome segregation ATPase